MSAACAVLDAETLAVLKTWPYHLILCWGFTATTFQLKAFTPPPVETESKEDDPLGAAGPRVLIPTPSLRNIKVPEGSAEIEAVVMRTEQVRARAGARCWAVCHCHHEPPYAGRRDGGGDDDGRDSVAQGHRAARAA